MKIQHTISVALASLALTTGLPANARQQGCTTATGEPAPAPAATGACEVLHWDRAGFDKPTLSINRPGKYCLDQDYEFFCSPIAHSCRGELLHIRASDETGFVVEHMQFSDVRTAIMVGCSGNQIRDNRIDATLDNMAPGGPPFALLSYGPAARIERNTFRLSDLTPGWKGYDMYLRSADGTLLANNSVQVDRARTGTQGHQPQQQ